MGATNQAARSSLPSPIASASPEPTPTPYVRVGLTAATVTRVVDGDTIRVEIDGQEHRVRYIGIDTPETRGVLSAASARRRASATVSS